MKVKKYLEELQKFVKKNPKALEFEAVYAKDSEGNGYYPVSYTPSLGRFDDREFDLERTPKNAVCIN